MYYITVNKRHMCPVLFFSPKYYNLLLLFTTPPPLNISQVPAPMVSTNVKYVITVVREKGAPNIHIQKRTRIPIKSRCCMFYAST